MIGEDLFVRPGRGLPGGLLIPAGELVERFSRSSGPGGQSVNTTDSRVELSWDVAASAVLDDEQRQQLLDRLGSRVNDGVLTIAASEHRSQLQNRNAARLRLRHLVATSLEPPSPPRRATRPSRTARARRVDDKRRHGDVKALRRRPTAD
ncbi:MAG TPA: alternative ribosome rescue aminoacyl-tRNA hydrolase ArfB [Jatrophihabitans sp.]|nr:alternative ribosome rescue aminoacyl-tRNA hydrolase ArfB [Jatrophihabitans sp.]